MRFTRGLLAAMLLVGLASVAVGDLRLPHAPIGPPTPLPPPTPVIGTFSLTDFAVYVPGPVAPTPTPAGGSATGTLPPIKPPPPPSMPPVIGFSGTGKAVADATGVTVTLDTLKPAGGTTTNTAVLKVTFTNPLKRDTKYVNRFTGVGQAVLTIDGVDKSFDLVVIGDLVQSRIGKRIQGAFGPAPSPVASPAASCVVLPTVYGQFFGGDSTLPPSPVANPPTTP